MQFLPVRDIKHLEASSRQLGAIATDYWQTSEGVSRLAEALQLHETKKQQERTKREQQALAEMRRWDERRRWDEERRRQEEQRQREYNYWTYGGGG
jgi:hypothetical protein